MRVHSERQARQRRERETATGEGRTEKGWAGVRKLVAITHAHPVAAFPTGPALRLGSWSGMVPPPCLVGWVDPDLCDTRTVMWRYVDLLRLHLTCAMPLGMSAHSLGWGGRGTRVRLPASACA